MHPTSWNRMGRGWVRTDGRSDIVASVHPSGLLWRWSCGDASGLVHSSVSAMEAVDALLAGDVRLRVA